MEYVKKTATSGYTAGPCVPVIRNLENRSLVCIGGSMSLTACKKGEAVLSVHMAGAACRFTLSSGKNTGSINSINY
jgi:hypothetical protein